MSVEKFKELLDQTYQWPDYYEFKFIVKMDDKELVLSHLAGYSVVETPSKNGNYISITARRLIKNTQEVVDVYELMSKIKGLISL